MRKTNLILVAPAVVVLACGTTNTGGSGSGAPAAPDGGTGGQSGAPAGADGGAAGSPADAGPTIPMKHALRVHIAGNGSVRGASFDCRSDCTQQLDDGQTVQLEALPDPGWSF